MFALIETNNATHIAIYIPQDGAAQTLPMLARMLEENAKFIRSDYNGFSISTPRMTIVLGDKYSFSDRDDIELQITGSNFVIGEEFVVATPELLTSNKKAVNNLRDEITKLRKQLEVKNMELETLKQNIADLTESDSERSGDE